MPSAPSGTTARPRKTVYLGDPLAEPPAPDLLSLLEPYQGRRDTVVSVLQALQERYGYLPERAMRYAARELGVPLARIYGVATFYNQFRFTPPARYSVHVCRGTACHVAGSGAVLTAIKKDLSISEDESTPDGMFSLQTVACIGCCSLAPAIVVNQDVHGTISPERTRGVLDRYRALEAEASQ